MVFQALDSTEGPGAAVPVTRTVRTVTGPVPTHELGHIASHEHLLCDLRPKAADGWTGGGPFAMEPISLQTYYEIRRQDINVYNLVLDSEEDALAELQAFRAAGGGTMVDLTPVCIGRDPEALRRLSRASGVHIVMGCGWYVHEFHGDEPHRLSVEELRETMVGDLREGRNGVPAGVIGEIGLSWPVIPCEDAVLQAAVQAQVQTGACLVIHPGRHPLAAFGAVTRVRELGGDVSRTVISHIERTLFTIEEMVAVARTNATLSFDLFGHEASHYAHADIDMPNDAERISLIRKLVDRGVGNRVVISQDICTKVHTKKWGGEGYTHIIDHVIPQMKRRGFSKDEIAALTHDNPVRLLAMSQNIS